MNKWKSYIGMLFLAVLSLSIVPRSLLHDCDHAHEISTNESGDEVLPIADCAICDYHFSTYSPPETFGVAEAMPTVIHQENWPQLGLHTVSRFLLPTRGPPTC